MTKEELIEKLKQCRNEDVELGHTVADRLLVEWGHIVADRLLIDYINDPDIAKAYANIRKHYSWSNNNSAQW